MTKTPIDLKVVAERLSLVDRYLEDLRAIPTEPAAFSSDRRNPAAAESLVRRSLECLLDTARHLLAKGFAVGALEYRQVALEARSKGLIRDAELAARFEKMAGFRTRLTHHYEEVTHEELRTLLTDFLPDIANVRAELQAAAGRLASDEAGKP